MLLATLVLKIHCNESKSFEELFNLGKEAYLSNDWSVCSVNMEKAIRTYKEFSEIMLECQESCHNFVFDHMIDKEFEELRFYEKMIRSTLCLIRCKKAKFGDSADANHQFASEATIQLFETKEPYNYLQLCYSQVSNFFLQFCFKILTYFSLF